MLQIDPEASIEDAKKKFRRMSIMVHPDKNPDDKERAQVAFDAVKRAWEENKMTLVSLMSLSWCAGLSLKAKRPGLLVWRS